MDQRAIRAQQLDAVHADIEHVLLHQSTGCQLLLRLDAGMNVVASQKPQATAVTSLPLKTGLYQVPAVLATVVAQAVLTLKRTAAAQRLFPELADTLAVLRV